jgi:triosephosphate isomerase
MNGDQPSLEERVDELIRRIWDVVKHDSLRNAIDRMRNEVQSGNAIEYAKAAVEVLNAMEPITAAIGTDDAMMPEEAKVINDLVRIEIIQKDSKMGVVTPGR